MGLAPWQGCLPDAHPNEWFNRLNQGASVAVATSRPHPTDSAMSTCPA